MEKQIKQEPIKTDDVNSKQMLQILWVIIIIACGVFGIFIGSVMSNMAGGIY